MSSFIEIPASKNSIANRKPIQGVGINDAEYAVSLVVAGGRVVCPYYRVWSSMIVRAYSDKKKLSRPTYLDCSVVDDWLIFSNFKSWMVKKEWKGKELDKDLLVYGNKTYGPDFCIFVSTQINNLLCGYMVSGAKYPKGVYWNKKSNKYQAGCKVNGKQKHLGCFDGIDEAECAYLSFKAALIKKTAYEKEALSNKSIQDALLRHADIFKQKAHAKSQGKTFTDWVNKALRDQYELERK